MRRSRGSTNGNVLVTGSLLGSRVPMLSLIQTLAVAEHLNFRHAAAALGVSQSSVSTRIKVLEENIGTTLFERRHRGVRLTEAGSRFVAEVAVGIRHLDHAIVTAGAIASGAAGRVRVGVTCPVAGGFLGNLRRAFRTLHPDVDLLISEGSRPTLMQQVREGAFDIVFLLGTIDSPDCHVRHLWSEPFVIAIASDHPLATSSEVLWEHLAAETFLDPRPGTGVHLYDHVVRRLGERGRHPRIRHCDAGRQTLMHLVAGGEGIKLTTEAASYVPFPGIVFRRISDETETARFSAVWSPANRSPALRNFLDTAAQMVKSALSA